MNDSRLAYSVPTPDGREWMCYHHRKKGWSATRTPAKSHPAGYVYPACECISIPLWINSDDRELIPQLVAFEIEKLIGLSTSPGDPSVVIRKVIRKDQHLLVHVSIIGNDLADGYDLSRNWKRFLVSPVRYQNDQTEIQLWQEDGRWVAGFYLRGMLVHWHSFGIGELTSSQLNDLKCILEDLQFRDICGSPTGVRIHGEKLASTVIPAEIPRLLGLPVVDQANESAVRFPSLSADTKPPSFVAFQERQKRIQLGILTSAAVIMLIAAGVFFAWFDLKRQEQAVADLERRVAYLEPRAENIRQTRDRWEALAPAVDPENFPIEVFHRVASLLPDKGIRLSEFSIQRGRITVRGEASNVPTAIKFKADLEKNLGLSHYQWEVPPPQISGDTAKFVAYGIDRKESVPTSIAGN